MLLRYDYNFESGEKGEELVTYQQGKHWIGGLKTVRRLFPEIAVPFNGGDVAANTVCGLSENDICISISISSSVVGGKGMGDGEAGDAAANNHAVQRGRVFGGDMVERRQWRIGFGREGDDENGKKELRNWDGRRVATMSMAATCKQINGSITTYFATCNLQPAFTGTLEERKKKPKIMKRN